jgi:HAE1 family hydrophobic/amphiphilic exporter-1
VVGGLVVSQLLTLYFTPVYYVYLDALRAKVGNYFRTNPGLPHAETKEEPESVPNPLS